MLKATAEFHLANEVSMIVLKKIVLSNNADFKVNQNTATTSGNFKSSASPFNLLDRLRIQKHNGIILFPRSKNQYVYHTIKKTIYLFMCLSISNY